MMARPRLFQWQRWLTVAEAAKYLTRALEEEVSEANIFQLALNRALTLSVRFPNQDTRAEQLTAARTYDRYGPGPHDFERGPDEEPDPDNPIITLPDGLYDLPMTGIERLDVEHEYQQRTGGPKIIARPKTVTDCDGPFVKSRLNGALFRIQREADRPDEASQSGRYLPPDAVFVVRVGALEAILPTRTERETTTRNVKWTPIFGPAAKVVFEPAPTADGGADTMKKTRTKHSPAFKAKVALAALRDQESVAEIARRYKVHANVVYKWKRQLLDNAAQSFEMDHSDGGASDREDVLLKKIGELTVERDFLSNGLGRSR